MFAGRKVQNTFKQGSNKPTIKTHALAVVELKRNLRLKYFFRSMGGFTLAELLIALAILGIIATFTIPKVLNNSQDTSHNAMAKEAAAAISGAYDAYRLENTITSTSNVGIITPYLNYVRIDTTSLIDGIPTQPDFQCSNTNPCYLLHNGGSLHYYPNNFNGTTSMSALNYRFDPDSRVTAGTGEEGMAVSFWLYTNGRLTTRGDLTPGTINSSGTCPCGPNSNLDPDWFSW